MKNKILAFVNALSNGLDKLFEQITNIKIIESEFPDESSVRGLVKIVSDSKYKRLPFSIKK